MNPEAKTISITVPAHRLFKWITTEGSSTRGVTYQKAKKFVESYTYSWNAKELLGELLEIGLLERVGRKYVIPGKKQIKRGRPIETTVSGNGAKNALEQTSKILEAPIKKVKRLPKIRRSHTKAAERATVRPIPGNTSNTNARRNSRGNSAGIYAGPFSAGINAEPFSDGINAGHSSDEKNVKRPNPEDIQLMEWMWNQDVFIHDHQSSIHDKLINFKLDTGAQANILPLYLFNDLKLYENSNLCKTEAMINSLGNFLTKPEGVVSLLCSTERVKNVALPFIVVNISSGPILGLDGCKVLNLIKRTDSKD